MSKPSTIDSCELRDRMKSSRAPRLIDVRTPAEFDPAARSAKAR